MSEAGERLAELVEAVAGVDAERGVLGVEPAGDQAEERLGRQPGDGGVRGDGVDAGSA